MLAYGNEEYVDPYTCRMADLRKDLVMKKIKALENRKG